MTLRARLHWGLFACYVALFFTLPLTLLWGRTGLEIGAILAVGFLIYLAFRGNERIGARLAARPLSKAEAPVLHVLVNEHSRRLGIAAPRIGIVETKAVNLAAYGFSIRRSTLLVTRGLIETLSRQELSALIGRELAYVWHGDVVCDSWLSQFLSLIDQWVSPRKTASVSAGKRVYGFRVVARQILLYPLTLFPVFILRVTKDALDLDLKSVRVTRRPHAYAEALRRLECLQNRVNYSVPFSTRHLFVLAPPSEDPLARVFFGTDSLSSRINAIEALKVVVGAAQPQNS